MALHYYTYTRHMVSCFLLLFAVFKHWLNNLMQSLCCLWGKMPPQSVQPTVACPSTTPVIRHKQQPTSLAFSKDVIWRVAPNGPKPLPLQKVQSNQNSSSKDTARCAILEIISSQNDHKYGTRLGHYATVQDGRNAKDILWCPCWTIVVAEI